MKFKKIIERKGALYKASYIEINNVPSNKKIEKINKLDDLIIIVNINNEDVEFQADKSSIDLLSSWLLIMKDKNIDTVKWKAFNNKIYNLLYHEIQEIIYKSLISKTNIWIGE